MELLGRGGGLMNYLYELSFEVIMMGGGGDEWSV